jgi:hypothetical protein
MPIETAKECATRVKQYLDWENKDFQTRLAGAETMGDKRDILVAYTKPSANLINLFTDPSPTATDVVEELARMAEQQITPAPQAPQAPLAPKYPPRTFSVYDDQGKLLYKRSQRRMFTEKELMFLEKSTQKAIPNKVLIEKFNAKFTPRTESSIVTKRYRL